MKILVAHNRYQHAGGEDSVVESEIALLQQQGHDVRLYGRHNDELGHIPRQRAAQDAIWSRQTTRDIKAIASEFRPDVIHVHNTFPLISPSLYWAANRAGIPVVQTLHNFRLLCPQAMLLRNGSVCEDCVGKSPWNGVTRGCYRNSRVQSAVLAGMLTAHRALGTYRHKIARYIALNDFCRDVFIRGGLPAEKIAVKPNFVAPAPLADSLDDQREGFLFVGRLSSEKGIRTLADAMRMAAGKWQCTVVGTGDEDGLLRNLDGVSLAGWQDGAAIQQRMRASRALVMPSIWYENFPRTLVEAFSCGLPVIASRLGAMATLIRDGETGLLFDPASADDLCKKLEWANTHPDEMARMGKNALREYTEQYTPQRNYQTLMAIYDDALSVHSRSIQ